MIKHCLTGNPKSQKLSKLFEIQLLEHWVNFNELSEPARIKTNCRKTTPKQMEILIIGILEKKAIEFQSIMGKIGGSIKRKDPKIESIKSKYKYYKPKIEISVKAINLILGRDGFHKMRSKSSFRGIPISFKL